jgi:hypothetical protein
MAAVTEDEYAYMPLDAVHKATGIVQHITNSWWAVHPERGLLFFPYNKRNPDLKHSSPQCNSNEAITRRLVPAFAEVRYIESVLIPIDPKEYA